MTGLYWYFVTMLALSVISGVHRLAMNDYTPSRPGVVAVAVLVNVATLIWIMRVWK